MAFYGEQGYGSGASPPGGAHDNIDMEILRNQILENRGSFLGNRVPLLDLLAQQRLGGAQSLGMPNLGMEYTPNPMSQFLGLEGQSPLAGLAPPSMTEGLSREGQIGVAGQQLAPPSAETLNLLERLLKLFKKKK